MYLLCPQKGDGCCAASFKFMSLVQMIVQVGMMFFNVAFAIYMINRCDNNWIDILIKIQYLKEKLHVEGSKNVGRLPCLSCHYISLQFLLLKAHVMALCINVPLKPCWCLLFVFISGIGFHHRRIDLFLDSFDEIRKIDQLIIDIGQAHFLAGGSMFQRFL